MDIKANKAARMTVRRFEQEESKATRVIFKENYGSAWQHVQRWQVIEFMGFAHRRLRSTSVWLISSDEGLHRFERGGTTCLRD